MALGIRSPRVKLKSCCECKVKFEPESGFDKTCSFECKVSYGIKLANKSKAKREQAERIQQQVDRKVIRIKKEALKTRADWMRDAERAVNTYVRTRDKHLPCISCGRFHEGQWHAGHYRSKGSAPHLRFDAERNIFRQCAPCNTYLSGNLINYRRGLIERIGLLQVEALEADNEPRKYSIDELKSIKAKYTAMTKELTQ